MVVSSKGYLNLEKINFQGVGEYDIPQISPVYKFDYPSQFILFSDLASTKLDKSDVGVTFYLDDYRFNRVWNKPDKYLRMLQMCKCVLSPDFSIYTDFPRALQIYNHYRKHWLAAYWQFYGITVIPTICWADRESFKWCFDGEPRNSIVSVSTVGTQKVKEERFGFLDGFNEMLARLEPSTVLISGTVTKDIRCEIENSGVEILRIGTFFDKWRERGKRSVDEANIIKYR